MDRKDPMVFATRSEEHQLGYTGFSLDDFNGDNRDKKCSFKTRFGQVFINSGHTLNLRMFS